MYIKGKFGSGKDKPERIRVALAKWTERRRAYKPPRGYSYDRYCKNGIPVETLSKGSAPESVVFIVHGGCLYAQITDYYRDQMQLLLGKTNALAVMVDYGSIPASKYPSQLNEVYTTFTDITTKFDGNVVVFADGVGAALAVACLSKAKREGVTMPKGLVLVQPFLDFSLSGDSIYDHFYFDKLFGNFVVSLPDLKDQLSDDKFFDYLCGQNRRDPLVSPLFDDLSGFPKTYVVTGDYSVFESDALRFVDKLKEAGVEVILKDYHEKYGAYPFDSKGSEKKKIADFITSILGEASVIKREKVKAEKGKRVKFSLNAEPIEPQDESATFDDDAGDVIFSEGDPDSFEAIFREDE